MAYRNTNQNEKLQQLTDRLQDGVRDIFDSGKYEEYLRVMSKFHRYSFRNTLLIAMQNPNATMVASYSKWQELGRQVQRGEKAIQILAPAPYKVKREREVLDPVTHQPVLQSDGSVVTREEEVTIPAFRPTSVFDISQTQGREIPSLFENLEGDVDGYKKFMKAMNGVSPVPIGFEAMNDKDGYYDQIRKEIYLRDDMSERQTVAAVIHETAHAILHNLDMDNLKESLEQRGKDKQTLEVEAESIAYVVSQYYGIETGENSFGYIAMWSRSKELPQLQASLDTIRNTAAELIDGLDARMEELSREQEILTAVEDRYAIYQIRIDFPLRRDYSFRNLASLEQDGIKPNRDHYQLIYDGKLEEGDSLNGLYEKFNIDHPEDFRGHSLSVSDIIVLHQDGRNTAYYVDSIGFEELPEFLEVEDKVQEYKPLAKVEELEESNYNMIDNVINNQPTEKETIKLEYYAAVCDEFHDMAACYTGENLEEIAEKYREIRNDPSLGYMGNGFGIIWHDTENDLYDGIDVSLIHGNHIEGDILDHTAFLAAEPKVYAVLERLQELFPDYEYTPPKTEKDALYPAHMTAEQLAAALVDLAREYDPYEYNDLVDSVLMEQTVFEDTLMDLRSGSGYEIIPYFEDIVEDGNSEFTARAEVLIEKIKAYKPDIPENMEPKVKIIHCEENALQSDVYWKISDLDKEIAFLDQKLASEINPENQESDKTLQVGFRIYYAGTDKVETFTDRITIGEGNGGLVQSLKASYEEKMNDEDWIKYQQGKGEENFQAYMADMANMQEKILPYLQSFCSVEERVPEKVEQTQKTSEKTAVKEKASVQKPQKKKPIKERLAEKKAIVAKQQGKANIEKGVELA